MYYSGIDQYDGDDSVVDGVWCIIGLYCMCAYKLCNKMNLHKRLLFCLCSEKYINDMCFLNISHLTEFAARNSTRTICRTVLLLSVRYIFLDFEELQLKRKLFLAVLVCLAALHKSVEGHGRLIQPPSRSTVWRYLSDELIEPYESIVEINYNDNQLFCGGAQVNISLLCISCKIQDVSGSKHCIRPIEKSMPG